MHELLERMADGDCGEERGCLIVEHYPRYGPSGGTVWLYAMCFVVALTSFVLGLTMGFEGWFIVTLIAVIVWAAFGYGSFE